MKTNEFLGTPPPPPKFKNIKIDSTSRLQDYLHFQGKSLKFVLNINLNRGTRVHMTPLPLPWVKATAKQHLLNKINISLKTVLIYSVCDEEVIHFYGSTSRAMH